MLSGPLLALTLNLNSPLFHCRSSLHFKIRKEDILYFQFITLSDGRPDEKKVSTAKIEVRKVKGGNNGAAIRKSRGSKKNKKKAAIKKPVTKPKMTLDSTEPAPDGN